MYVDFTEGDIYVVFQEYHVVLLCPMDIESHLRMLIQAPMWSQRVTYIKGSALNENDLERAK